jgi:hypothetical protein
MRVSVTTISAFLTVGFSSTQHCDHTTCHKVRHRSVTFSIVRQRAPLLPRPAVESE